MPLIVRNIGGLFHERPQPLFGGRKPVAVFLKGRQRGPKCIDLCSRGLLKCLFLLLPLSRGEENPVQESHGARKHQQSYKESLHGM